MYINTRRLSKAALVVGSALAVSGAAFKLKSYYQTAPGLKVPEWGAWVAAGISILSVLVVILFVVSAVMAIDRKLHSIRENRRQMREHRRALKALPKIPEPPVTGWFLVRWAKLAWRPVANEWRRWERWNPEFDYSQRSKSITAAAEYVATLRALCARKPKAPDGRKGTMPGDLTGEHDIAAELAAMLANDEVSVGVGA